MWKLVAVVSAVALLAGGAAQGASKAAPVNTSPPTISGTDRAGETLTAASGSWNNSPTSFSYRWQRCNSSGAGCDNISGATNQTYQLQKSDTGRRVRVSVTAKNADGSANATSGPTGVIAQGLSPANSSLPTISGTPKAGQTLTATTGSWSNSPTHYDYQWRRCDTGGNDCHDVGGNRSTFVPDSGDVGHTIRVEVKARNDYGSTTARSAPTGVVAPGGPAPANSVPPTISGVPRDGQMLVATTGTWTNSPTKYGFQWLRCDTVGNNCSNFGGNGQSQRLASSEVGHTVRVTVSASNQFGTTKSTSVPTAIVAAASTAPGSISVSQVTLPQRLVISGVKFIPSRLTSRGAFLARFRVSDTRGNLVNGALVYALGIPYGWVRNAPEVVSGGDGWATIQFVPTRLMPIHRRAALVMFVRARKPGESLLAGVSARRLVQISIR
jgi:hypothetical protein